MPTVLFASKHTPPWYRQFPDGEPVWGDWRFVFSDTGETYDYLVIFEDISAPIARRCRPENTLHVAAEPVSVKPYARSYTDQFGMCVSVDPEIQHPHAIISQLAINWFLGWNPKTGSGPGAMSFRNLEALFDQPRDKLISVIASNKVQTAGHHRRLNFAMDLKSHFGDRMDFYGRGFVPMQDKLDALARYRFHVVLENSAYPHYFTEKFTDTVIAGCYPFYAGCPNLDDYFPENAFSRIDPANVAASIQIIERAIAEDYDQSRRAALREAQRRAMYEHNMFPMLVRILSAHASGEYGQTLPPAGQNAGDIMPCPKVRTDSMQKRALKFARKVMTQARMRRL